MGWEQLPPKYDEDIGDWPDVDLVTELQQAHKRIKFLETCCVIESMLANPNVNSLIKQHEKRIAELESLLQALVEASECITKKYFDEKTILHMVDFEYLKAAIAATKVTS